MARSRATWRSYLPLIIPGILAQTTLTACIATGVQLREDMDKGVFDRFNSLPIARIAPLAGPMIADVIRYTVATVLTFATGIAMGYRPGGGVLGVLAAAILVIACGWSMAWIFTWVGIKGRSAQAVQAMSMMIMFPLTFMSNAFVPADTLPGWLEAFVNVNPVSHVVTAVRDLANNGQRHRRGRLGRPGLRRRGGGLRAAVGAGLSAQGPLNDGRGLLGEVRGPRARRTRPAPGRVRRALRRSARARARSHDRLGMPR